MPSGISTYVMYYLFDPFLSNLLVDLLSWIPDWAWSLSIYQVQRHFYPCLQPTGPPLTTHTPSSSVTSRYIVASLVPPTNPFIPALSITPNAPPETSIPFMPTTFIKLISTSSRRINHTLLVHTAFFHQVSISWYTPSLLKSPNSALDTLPISSSNRWPK